MPHKPGHGTQRKRYESGLGSKSKTSTTGTTYGPAGMGSPPPNNNNNNECYIEWIECGQRIYWKEGESMTFDVEKLHQGSNQSDQSMEFLYIDVNPEVELE